MPLTKTFLTSLCKVIVMRCRPSYKTVFLTSKYKTIAQHCRPPVDSSNQNWCETLWRQLISAFQYRLSFSLTHFRLKPCACSSSSILIGCFGAKETGLYCLVRFLALHPSC